MSPTQPWSRSNGGRGKQSLRGFIDLDGPMGTAGGPTMDHHLWWQGLSCPLYMDMRGLCFMLGELSVPPILFFSYVIWWFFSTLGFPDWGVANALLTANPNNIDSEVLRYTAKYALDGTSTHTFAQLQDAHFRRKFREYYLNGGKASEGTYPPQPFPGDGYYYYSDNLGKISLPTLAIADDTPDLTVPEDIHNFYLGKARHKLDTFLRIPNTAHIDLVMGLNAPTELFPEIGKWLRSLCRRRCG